MKVEYVLEGFWDQKMNASKVISQSVLKGKNSLEVGQTRTLWKMQPIRAEAEKYYSFSDFACELNETEELVAPTDSRLRPDQRFMEEARWDEANEEKVRIRESTGE